MFIKLIKLKEVDNPLHPNNIEEGRVEVGFMEKEPEVGQRFLITDHARWFRTSMVQEIIDENTFRTYNSIYKIEPFNSVLDNENKINN